MVKNSWRNTLIGMLSCAALAACSPDEQTGTAGAPSAPAQQMPESDPTLAGNVPPVQSAPVEVPAQPAPEAQPAPQPQPQPQPETQPQPQPQAMNRAVLSWTAPTQYTDGTALNDADLAGFRIYHGQSESSLAPVAEVDGEEFSMTIEDLATGTHYFAVTAVTISGVESSFSAIGSKRVM